MDKTDDTFRGGVGLSSSDGLFLQYNNASDNKSVLYLTNKEFYPMTNNTYSLGTLNKKWSNIHATTFNGTLNGNIWLSQKTDSQNYPMVFASGTGSEYYSRSLHTDSTGFAYNPGTNTLTVGNLNITNSVSATSLSSWSRIKNLSRGYNYCTYTSTSTQSGEWYGYTINLNSS